MAPGKLDSSGRARSTGTRSGAFRHGITPVDRLQNGGNRVPRLGSIRKTARQNRAGNEFNEFGLRQLLQSRYVLVEFMQDEQQPGDSLVRDVNV